MSRGRTIVFSRRAVICRRDGVHCLLFRVADMRSSHLVDVSIRALLIRWRHSPSGTSLCQHPVSLSTEIGDGLIHLFWPVTVVHKITSSSPLWNLTASSLAAAGDKMEIVVILQVCAECLLI